MVWVYENVLPIMRPGDATPSAVLISFNDIGPARAAEQQLKFLAQRDALTGLYNRAYFLQRMQAVLDEAVTDGRQAAVLFLDLDGFKKVNDTAGHEAGDHLLRIVAQRLSACVRQTDTLARLGGDEFVVLLDQVRSLAEAEQLARRIIAAIAQPFSTGGTEYYLGASIGIAVHPDHGQDAATLLRCADAAMYNAKQNGRNQHRVFTAQLSQRAQRRFQPGAAPAARPVGAGAVAALPAHRRCRLDGHRRRGGAAALAQRRAWARCRPPSSFPWPRMPGSSSPSANGCWSRPAARRPTGAGPARRISSSP